jgi:hypothetical protein
MCRSEQTRFANELFFVADDCTRFQQKIELDARPVEKLSTQPAKTETGDRR